MHACSRRQRRLPRPRRRAGRRRRRSWPPPRRSASAGASTASGRCRSRRGSCPSRPLRWCLAEAGLTPADLDAVAYSFDPALRPPADGHRPVDDRGTTCGRMYAERAPGFLATALPGLDREQVRFVPHHVAHAASAGLAAPCAEPPAASSCSTAAASAPPTSPGACGDGRLEVLAGADAAALARACSTRTLTAHLGFRRSSDEYKVMALASYGQPRFLDELRELVRATGDGGFVAPMPRLVAASRRRAAPTATEWTAEHADLAASRPAAPGGGAARAGPLAARAHRRPDPGHGRRRGAQLRRQLPDLARERRSRTCGCSPPPATPARRSAPRCTSRRRSATPVAPMHDRRARARLDRRRARAPGCDGRRRRSTRPDDVADAVADVLADDGVVAWFQGRSEFGPRALGHRSLLAAPAAAPRTSSGSTTSRAASSSARSRRWCWPSARREIFTDGPMPSPYMLFVHDVAPEWRERIPAVVHVDGTARIQTVDRRRRAAAWPRCCERFERRTGAAGRRQHQPQHRRPADGRRPARRARVLRLRARSTLLALGPFVVRRAACPTRTRRMTADRRPAVRRRRPDHRPAQPARAARRRWPRGAGRRRGEVVVVDDRPGDVEPLTARVDLGACAPARVLGAGGRGPAAARNARLAGGAARRGSPSSTTTSLPARLARGPGRRTWPRWRRDVAGVAGPDPSSRCRRTGAPTDWERPRRRAARRARWATADMAYRRDGARGRSAASTSASRAPTARTPTWRCGSSRRGLAARSRAAHDVRIPSARPRRGQPAGAARQRRRRADARGCTAAAGASAPERRPGPVPPARSHRGRRGCGRHRRWPLAAVGGGRRRGSPAPAPWPGWPDGRASPAARIAPGPRDAAEVGDDAR